VLFDIQAGCVTVGAVLEDDGHSASYSPDIRNTVMLYFRESDCARQQRFVFAKESGRYYPRFGTALRPTLWFTNTDVPVPPPDGSRLVEEFLCPAEGNEASTSLYNISADSANVLTLVAQAYLPISDLPRESPNLFA
jgi:hypothetical protein